jgi:hypothetical protein
MKKYLVGLKDVEELRTEVYATDSQDAKRQYLIWANEETKRRKQYFKLLGKKMEYVCEVVE